MNGRPLMHWLMFCLCWGLLLIPLLRLSSAPSGAPRAAPVAEAGEQARQTVPIWINWRLTEPPASATIALDGDEVWRSAELGEERVEELAELEWPEGGFELEIRVEWTAAAQRAVELKLEPVDGVPVTVTRFSSGSVLEERIVIER
jgi:hypothetical protein